MVTLRINCNLYCLPCLCSLSAVPPCKVQRLHSCSPRHQESSNFFPPSTPSRPTAALGTTIRCTRPRHTLSNNGTKVTLPAMQKMMQNEEELPSGHNISSPSPPSPPQSPSVSSPLSHPILSETSADNNQKEGCEEYLYKTTRTLKTPTKLNEMNAYSASPSSSSKYHRVLEPSVMSPGNESPKASSVSVMDRFNAIYQSLKSKPEWDSEVEGGDSTPLLDITSGSHSQGVIHSSKVLRRAPACPFITVTGSEGERVYLKLQSKKVSTRDLLCYQCVWIRAAAAALPNFHTVL